MRYGGTHEKHAEQAGAANRLTAARRKRHGNNNPNLEVEAALPITCGRPLTAGIRKTKPKQKAAAM